MQKNTILVDFFLILVIFAAVTKKRITDCADADEENQIWLIFCTEKKLNRTRWSYSYKTLPDGIKIK
jgi:hypothetical protein